jgi:hypothetical protein
MIGRLLAACGWLAWQIERRFAASPLRRLGARRVVAGLAVVLVALGFVPIAAAVLQDQPQDIVVEDVTAGRVTDPAGWVRLRGQVVPLADSPTGQDGDWGILVDAVDTLRAIVVRAPQPLTMEETFVTGHLASALVVVEEELPIEATVFGTPPRIVSDQIVELDAVPLAPRTVLWPLVLLPWALASVIGLGAMAGYPVFRRTREVDVLARPMAPGERVPAAVAGRIGAFSYALGEPAGALVLVGQGPRGGILTVQLLPQNGPAPAPVRIGGGWTSGRIGYVYTIDEVVPALAVRAEAADAVLLFARVAERDRAAAMVAVDR